MPEPRHDPPYGSEDEAREAMADALAALGVMLGAASGAWSGAALGTSRGAWTGAVTLSLRWRRSGAEGFLVTSGPQASADPVLEHVAWTTLAEPASDDEDAADQPAQWRLHRDVYRQRRDVVAIVRSRPAFSTALACMPAIRRSGIPFFHPDVSVAGGDSIRCAADAPPGSPAGSDQVLAALQDRTACLLAGRGLLVTGPTLSAAVGLTAEIEALAQIYCQILQLQATAAGEEVPMRRSAGRAMAGEGQP